MQTIFNIPNYSGETWIFPKNANLEDSESLYQDEEGEFQNAGQQNEEVEESDPISDNQNAPEQNGNFIVDLAHEFFWFYYEDTAEAKAAKLQFQFNVGCVVLLVFLIIISNL